MFSNLNLKKIFNDRDVVASRGRDSLTNLHTAAVAVWIFHTRKIRMRWFRSAPGPQQQSIDRIRESFDFFFERLISALSLGVLEQDVLLSRVKATVGVEIVHSLILFDEEV